MMDLMDTVKSVPNENDDMDEAKLDDDDTSTEDAENVAFKEDQLEVHRRAGVTVQPIASCVWIQDVT